VIQLIRPYIYNCKRKKIISQYQKINTNTIEKYDKLMYLKGRNIAEDVTDEFQGLIITESGLIIELELKIIDFL